MNKQVRLGNIYNEASGTGFAGNVWDVKGISPTLTCMGNGGRQPMIIVSSAVHQGEDVTIKKTINNN